jgi:hypothetical protein
LSAAQITAVLASKAGIVRIIGALNDVGQDFPTAGTSGATAAANVQAAVPTILNSGRLVIIEAEPGQNGMTSGRLGQIYEYNQRMREFCERTPGCYWHDARLVVIDFTSSTGNYKANYTYDGTHSSALGGYYWGKSLLNLLNSITPTRQALLTSLGELPANGRWQLLDNPLFTTTTGGSTSTGVTGTFPGSCTVNKTGAGTTVACTPTAGSVSLAIQYGATADNARMSMTATLGNWSIGDWIQGICQVSVTNPSGLAGAQFSVVPTVDSVAVTLTDMFAATTMLGPDESFNMVMLTDPYQITGTTKNSLVPTVYFNASGAGSAFTAVVQQMAVIRRIAAYGG